MKRVVLAPFSNSGIRDWPGSYYRSLAALLLEAVEDIAIRVIGTGSQRQRGAAIVRPFPVTVVTNECGSLTTSGMMDALRSADCVVTNNSGVGHIAGRFGIATICIFGGTHNRREWRALGENVILVSRVIGCSPCQIDNGDFCPYDKSCLREIAPDVVSDLVIDVLGKGSPGGRILHGSIDRESSSAAS